MRTTELDLHFLWLGSGLAGRLEGNCSAEEDCLPPFESGECFSSILPGVRGLRLESSSSCMRSRSSESSVER